MGKESAALPKRPRTALYLPRCLFPIGCHQLPMPIPCTPQACVWIFMCMVGFPTQDCNVTENQSSRTHGSTIP